MSGVHAEEIGIVAAMVKTQRRRQELKAVSTRLERLYWALQEEGDQALEHAVYQAYMWASSALAASERRDAGRGEG